MDFLLKYRDFRGSACFDRVSRRHYGIVLDVADRIVYESLSDEGLIANFEAAVDEYIDFQKDLADQTSDELAHRLIIGLSVRHAHTAS
jgi:hypothetical protein